MYVHVPVYCILPYLLCQSQLSSHSTLEVSFVNQSRRAQKWLANCIYAYLKAVAGTRATLSELRERCKAFNISGTYLLPLLFQERCDPFISLSLRLEKLGRTGIEPIDGFPNFKCNGSPEPHLITCSIMAAAIPFITVVEIVLVSTFLHLFFAFRDHQRRQGLPYPPGPKRWPIIGNLLDSPKQSQWITYTEMSKKHGLGDVIARCCIPFTETGFHVFQATFFTLKFLGRQSSCSVPFLRSKTYSRSVGKSSPIVLLCQCIECKHNPALLPLLD
jgi:hypothetical protein